MFFKQSDVRVFRSEFIMFFIWMDIICVLRNVVCLFLVNYQQIQYWYPSELYTNINTCGFTFYAVGSCICCWHWLRFFLSLLCSCVEGRSWNEGKVKNVLMMLKVINIYIELIHETIFPCKISIKKSWERWSNEVYSTKTYGYVAQ